MIQEYILGNYEIDNFQPRPIQHSSKIHKLLEAGLLPVVISELIGNGDLELKIKILKDELWSSQRGFGRTDKYCVLVEVDNDLEC